jgi:hypothetical protein
MSTIAAGTAVGTALVSTGDTTGQLQLQVNGTTPAVTLNTAGAVGVGPTPVYGTSGQVLVSGGAAAAPAWTTLAGFNPAYMGYTTQNGQAITTVLTSASTIYQVFTGTGLSNSTVQLPVTSTLSVGWTFNIRNDSIVNVLVNSSGSNLLITIPADTSAMVTCVATGGTTASDWKAGITNFTTYNGTGSVVLRVQPDIRNPNITDGLLLNSLAGTAGQVLTSAGSSNVPTWTTPGGGGNWILLQTNAFSSAITVDFSNMSSTYDLYFLEGVITSTGGVYPNPMAYRFINSVGTVITSSFYRGNQWGGEENASSIRTSSAQTYGNLSYAYFTNDYDINLNMYIMRSPNNETNGVYGTILSLYSTPISPSQFTGGWGSNTSGTLNVGGIRIFDAGANVASLTGTLRLWGWKKT